MVITSKEQSWWRIYLYVIITYIISHGLMLLVYGAWWDDMLLWNVSADDLEEFIGPEKFNNPFMYYPIKWIATIEDVQVMTFVYRLTPFICWFVSLTSFLTVIKKITNNKTFTLYSSLLAASCGLNKTMLMICCYHYSISIALFMLGLIFFVYDYYKTRYVNKILTALLWTLSLLVWRPAVLVIPALVAFVCYEKTSFNWKSKDSYINLLKYACRNYWILIIGLLLFVGLYTTLLSPKGEYQSYYHIDLLHIALSPLLTLTACISVLVQYFVGLLDAFAYPGKKYILSFVPFVMLLSILFRYNNRWYVGAKLLFVTFLVFYFSIYPQTLIGDTYSFYFNMGNQHSRIASLAIFPMAVLLCYFIKSISQKLQPIVLSLIVSGSIVLSNYTCLDYERGWARNEAIAQFLRENPELADKEIMTYNSAMEYSIFQGTGDSYYEYEGCARLAYGVNTKTRFRSFYVDDPNNPVKNPEYYLQILRNEDIPTYALMIDRLLSPEKYKEDIKKLLIFQLEKNQPVSFKNSN